MSKSVKIMSLLLAIVLTVSVFAFASAVAERPEVKPELSKSSIKSKLADAYKSKTDAKPGKTPGTRGISLDQLLPVAVIDNIGHYSMYFPDKKGIEAGMFISFVPDNRLLPKVDVYLLEDNGESLEKLAQKEAKEHNSYAGVTKPDSYVGKGSYYFSYEKEDDKEYICETYFVKTIFGQVIKTVVKCEADRIPIGNTTRSVCIPAGAKAVSLDDEWVAGAYDYRDTAYTEISGIIIYEGKIPEGSDYKKIVDGLNNLGGYTIREEEINGDRYVCAYSGDMWRGTYQTCDILFEENGKFVDIRILFPSDMYGIEMAIAGSIEKYKG